MTVQQAKLQPSMSFVSVGGRLGQLVWFAAIATVAFLVPFIFSSTLDLHHDLYYLIYFSTTLVAVGAYVKAYEIDLAERVRQNWQLSLGAGVLAAAFVVWSVLGRIDSTPHPDGAYFAFEIVWRGLVYGAIDALLLSAFPGLVAWKLFDGNIAGLGRRVAYGVTTLALVLVITAVYHLGYEDLRNREGISNPEIGNTIISVPVLLSANPAGSFLAHTSMHIAAVTHSYESKDRLPPQVFVDGD